MSPSPTTRTNPVALPIAWWARAAMWLGFPAAFAAMVALAVAGPDGLPSLHGRGGMGWPATFVALAFVAPVCLGLPAMTFWRVVLCRTPELVLTDEAFEVLRLWKRKVVPWDEVVGIGNVTEADSGPWPRAKFVIGLRDGTLVDFTGRHRGMSLREVRSAMFERFAAGPSRSASDAPRW